MALRAVPFQIVRESWEEQRQAGRYHPGLIARVMLKDRGLRLPIGAGGSDWPEVYRDADEVYVVVANSDYDYAGVEVFDLEGREIGQVFCQGDEVRAVLGPKGADLHPRTIARRLREAVGA